MQYRSFPKTPRMKISTLGFGCMRLPVLGGDFARIDEEKALPLLHAAIDAGVNYVDTAWPYHAGQSEMFVGRALKGGWRSRVQLATKLPVLMVKTEADWEGFLDNQLKKLDTGCIDFYLMHAISAEPWQTILKLHGLKALERAKADGRIGQIGFSFHGSPGDFKTIIDGFDWDFCQIQFNFLDEQFQAGLEGLQYATARKVGVVAMEPLRGGRLAKVPPAVHQIWERSKRPWSPAEWALRWVWHHPEVVTVLSGMNAEEQLRENLMAADAAETLSPEDFVFVDEVKKFYHSRTRVPCTTCGYCQPCPSGVSIPNALSLYNDVVIFESRTAPAFVYDHFFLKAGAGADQCTECGECEPKCPQKIPITAMLKEAHSALTNGGKSEG
jgi:predicted aldo/keto reductase-like oxidoreductase